MSMMIGGAAIFAIGAFFGAMIYAAGQQSQTTRIFQRIKDTFLDGMERAKSEDLHN